MVGTCPGGNPRFGNGLTVFRGGHIEASRFLLSDNELCGLQISDVDSAIDLHDGLVTRNTIGANVQTPGFDIGRLQDGVSYFDNEVALDSSVLPVPDPADAIGP
jgi:hypothetical protein